MPYSNLSELPEAVKKLPEAAQKMWMHVFNQYKAEGRPEDECFQYAWGAVKNHYTMSGEGEWHMKASMVNTLDNIKDEGFTWEVMIHKFGLDKLKRYWEKDALVNAIPIFEGSKVFVLDEAQHQEKESKYGKSVKQLVGWFSNVSSVSDGLKGNFNILKSSYGRDLRDQLFSAWQKGKKDLLGLSTDLRCSGEWKEIEGEKRIVVTTIHSATTDVVYDPASGGEFLKLVACVHKQEDNVTKEELDALAKKQEEEKKAFELSMKSAMTDLDTLKKETCTTLLSTMLSQSGLPEVVSNKLKTQFEGKIFTGEEVKNAIKAEKSILDILLKDTVSNVGDVRITVDVFDKYKKELDDVLSGKGNSIKSAYIHLTGDEGVTGQINFLRLPSSMTTASLTSIFRDAMHKRMLEEYGASPYDLSWEKIADVVPIADFRTNYRSRWGGYGNLPIVAEKGAYTSLSSPSDEESSYSVSKRGGTEDLTLEMIKNDDVGELRKIPRKLGTAAKRTLYEFVWDFIVTNPSIYDGIALFHASHSNLSTVAFSKAELAARRLAMMKQTEISSGKRLGLFPKYIISSIDMELTIVEAIVQEGVGFEATAPDFVRRQRYEFIPVIHLTDTNNWFTACAKELATGLEIGFLDNKREPELFVQTEPTVGSMFANDVITYKLRHIYGGGITDYRTFQSNIVA